MTWILCEILKAGAKKYSSGSVAYGQHYLGDSIISQVEL